MTERLSDEDVERIAKLISSGRNHIYITREMNADDFSERMLEQALDWLEKVVASNGIGSVEEAEIAMNEANADAYALKVYSSSVATFL